MKKYLYYLCMGLVGMLFLNSCDDDDDDIRVSEVPKVVMNTFDTMFTNVDKAEWEKNRDYYVAEFWYANTIVEAWFDSKGAWCMTETDLGMNLANLPEAVQQAFNGGQYATWRVDDIDKYERPNETFYLIEVEKNGQRDRNLFFAPDGLVLKDDVDRDGNEVTPDIQF